MRFCPICHGRYDDAAQFCPRDGEVLPVDPDDERIGTVLLGQFEILEVCGKGAMGTVYRAWQSGMERQVAVKVLRPELLGDPKLVARFDREARAVAKLAHPNIVTFFLVGTTADGLPFLAMEYVEGESLADVIDKQPIPGTARTLHVARQVASALAEAHAEGIVHRDLKPANILLTQKRRMVDFVKVLDFGIAKLLRGDSDTGGDLESRLTRHGSIFGTPHYMAPEQAAGAEVDHRADLYSLGVILYRMLTGHLPFDGTGIAVLLAHMSQVVTAPRELVPELDPRLDALVLRALAKEPAERFQTAEEMIDALDAAGAAPVRSGSSPVVLPPAAVDLPVSQPALDAAEADGPSAPRLELSTEPVRLPRRGRMGLAAVLLVGLTGAAAGGVYLAQRAPSSSIEAGAPDAQALATAIRPDAGAALAPDGGLELRPGYRVVTVGESGYAIRAQLPRDPRVGPSYDLIFDVVDPDGSTTDDPELPATTEEPGGGKRSFAIPQLGVSGRYILTRSFAAAGRYHVHLYPIPDEPKVHIWLDLLVKDENGRVPPDPAPVAHVDRPAAPVVAPVAASQPAVPPASTPSQPAAPPEVVPPVLGSLGRPPAPVRPAGAGTGEVDPYHLLSDAPPPVPPPVKPRTRPRHRAPAVQTVPRPKPANPDGLE